MYTLSLRRITLFKTGASFSEHSPLLHQLSTFPNWQKPHAGLRKMFMGEVAGKRVVVQGIWVGGWTWGPDVPTKRSETAREGGAQGTTRSAGAAQVGDGRDVHWEMSVTPAPWATERSTGVV
jgi:serine/threonine-protein phosphatase 2A activator